TPQLIQLGLVGREAAAAAGRTFEPAPPADGTRYFPETQHNLYGTFLRYWEKRGGVARFGFPISDELDEVAADGVTRRVQYFERARFEYHPEDLDGFYRGRGLNIASLHEVELGDLGRQVMLARGVQSPSFQALAAAPEWSPASWPRRIEVNLSEQQLYAYEGDLLVYQAPVATGRDGFNTPTGDYAIYDKYTMQTMVGNAGGESWYVPDIPWVQYVVGGVALHGTYWHDQWGTGTRMSHGCINLNIDDAQWLFQWAVVGVPVSIHY
ncbi:MAG: L,D-transpeptidase, partial [Chloroflexales bacterium]|nr:L,D-transpeptidase [Chloroflexales bacterium]